MATRKVVASCAPADVYVDIMLQYKFINEIAALSHVNKIILYGSRARGDATERSDIDLAVDCSGATDYDWASSPRYNRQC